MRQESSPMPSRSELDCSNLELIRRATNGQSAIYKTIEGYFVKTHPAPSEMRNGIHAEMLKKGFPVPSIIEEGMLNSDVDEAVPFVAIEDMGETYAYIEDMSSDLRVDPEVFQKILHMITLWTNIQATNGEVDPSADLTEVLYADELIEDIRTDLPEDIAQAIVGLLENVLPKLKQRLKALPRTCVHGDFVPRNMTDRGVIDLEFAHKGLLGYDAVSSLLHTYMFPRKTEDDSFEAHRTYEFSVEQISKVFDSIDQSVNIDGEKLSSFFDDIVLAKLIFSTSGESDRPHIQQYRLQVLVELLEAYAMNRPFLVISTLISIDDILARNEGTFHKA